MRRVAVVTGAGRGIGRAHAVELASHGATVVVNEVPDVDGRAAERLMMASVAATTWRESLIPVSFDLWNKGNIARIREIP